MVSDYRAIFPRFSVSCLETVRKQWCVFAKMMCKCAAYKNGGLTVPPVKEQCGQKHSVGRCFRSFPTGILLSSGSPRKS